MADFFNAYGGGYGRYGGGMGSAVGQAVGAMTGSQPPGAQDQIANMYRQVSGGTYTPTQQDIAQFGANPDATYLQKIAPQIQQWWNQNKAQAPTGAQPGGDVYGPSAAYQSQMGQAAGQMGQVAQQAFTPLSQLARGYGGYGPAAGYGGSGGGNNGYGGWNDGPGRMYGGYGGGYGQQPGGYLDANTQRPMQGGGVVGPGQAGPLQGGGGTVMLRAPNGQTQAVPADHVQYYLARGATRG